MAFNLNFETTSININLLKMFFIELLTYYTFLKITNNETKFDKKRIFYILEIILICIVVNYIRYISDYFVSIVVLVFLLSLLCSQENSNNLGHTILTIIISLSINYVLNWIAIAITFLINLIYPIRSDYINLTIIIFIRIISLYRLSKIKRFKKGISYLSKNLKNDFLDIILINISVIVSFTFIILLCVDVNTTVARSLFTGFIIFAIMMFITIQKSIQLYYKQKLLIQDLEDTKSELEKKKEEVQVLEKENLEISKKSHSLAHKQKSLEYKLNKLIAKTEFAEELDLKEKVENLSKELYVAPGRTEIIKTEVQEIDDMLSCMQAECEKNNIDFNLQVNGNIHYMINNLMSKEELEILLADHIKDAIIAINHSDNVNRSILVKIGKIDENYGLYIYDSGIEFEKETLENLGKKPSTTYKDEGGTGMGFMNTFETLRKHNASLVIRKLGKLSKDNFTKVIEFKFDVKNEFKVI